MSFKPNNAGTCESCGSYASRAASGIDANGECIICRRARQRRDQDLRAKQMRQAAAKVD